MVLAAAEKSRQFGSEIIVGLGGGSSMDVAKLIAVLADGSQALSTMYGIDKITARRLPLVQIPTTAGTGSEVTPISIVTVGETSKAGVVSSALYADLTILDAELTMALPPKITAATGIDAMVHAIEAYTSRLKKNPLSDMLAREALRLLSANLLTACRDGSNRAAREAMLLGATLAGQAFANAPVAAVHALAYPIGGVFHVAHGLSNALVLPHVLRFNLPVAAALYAELAEIIVPSLAKGTGSALVKQGGKSWYFLTADYAFGHSLESDTSAVVKQSGGTIVGSTRHPLGASDFSAFMLQAQASKAQILGLANAGGDTVNSIKAANEFGITKTMKLAGLLMFINDVHALTLNLTQGMYLTDGWYWDLNDETRAWSKRYFAKMKREPSMLQAADYSATMQYLNAVKAIATDDPDKVMAQLRKTKINDFFAKDGYIRADGRMVHDMYLMEVKRPAESKYPWDYYKVVQTIPGEQAYTTKAESKCALWK